MNMLLLMSMLVSVLFCSGEEVVFPSGQTFTTTSLDELTAAEIEEFSDPQNTGSQLYHTATHLDSKLSLNYKVTDFVQDQSVEYFRAHPLLFSCIQKVRTLLLRDGDKVLIKEGYKTATAAESDHQDQYFASGAGVVISLQSPTSGKNSMADVTENVLYICLPLFKAIQRDIGLKLYYDYLHINIQGQDEATAWLEVDDTAAMDQSTFEEWVLNVTNQIYDPVSTQPCLSGSLSLNNHSYISHPANTSLAQAASELDQIVTRNDTEDFSRLVQYPGTNILFEDSESEAGWCGSNEIPCVHCSLTHYGFAPQSSCADRMMTTRLMNRINILQKMVRKEWTDLKLYVFESWDEVYQGSPYDTGDAEAADSLHYEGRAAMIHVSDLDDAKLSRLSELAICTKFDYVEFRDDHLFVAVKKQKGSTTTHIQFISQSLIAVEAPAALTSTYQLPEDLDPALVNTVQRQHYLSLFDSNSREHLPLSNYLSIGDVKSPDHRYFRINKYLVQCHQTLTIFENKWNEDSDVPVRIAIERGYLTAEEDTLLYESDVRFGSHSAGLAFQLSYNQSTGFHPTLHTPTRLARNLVQKCGPLFKKNGYSIGIGLYEDSVFVSMRSSFLAYLEPENLINGTTEPEFVEELESWLWLANAGRIIDPENYQVTCEFSAEIQRQSISYFSQLSEVKRKRRRRRRRSTSSQECVPTSDTTFCTDTTSHRETLVNHIWVNLVKRKYLYHDENEVFNALSACLGACGTCTKGSIYESKLENCDNFLHWVPFGLNSAVDNTNFYSRSNDNMKYYACLGDEHCIEEAPLFSLVAGPAETLYRPDSSKSVEEQLYSSTDNPLPIFVLLYQIYAIHAEGTVKVWVSNAEEFTSLLDPIKVAMVFNRDVTDMKIYVEDESKVSSVVTQMENWILEWTKSTCPDHSRQSIPDYTVQSLSEVGTFSKRSVEYEENDQMREHLFNNRHNWERKWIDKQTFI